MSTATNTLRIPEHKFGFNRYYGLKKYADAPQMSRRMTEVESMYHQKFDDMMPDEVLVVMFEEGLISKGTALRTAWICSDWPEGVD
jgi:hypothetical protein